MKKRDLNDIANFLDDVYNALYSLNYDSEKLDELAELSNILDSYATKHDYPSLEEFKNNILGEES